MRESVSGRREDEDQETGVVIKERDEQKLSRPRMYRVLLHNDDYTPMDFVVRLLQNVFHRTESDASGLTTPSSGEKPPAPPDRTPLAAGRRNGTEPAPPDGEGGLREEKEREPPEETARGMP